MVSNWLGALTTIGCACVSLVAVAQTPELTVVARSPKDLQVVLNTTGQQAEILGLSGPVAFLNHYEQHLDSKQPLVAACAFSTQVPMFAAEFTAVDPIQLWTALAEDGMTLDAQSGQLSNDNGSLLFFVEQTGNKIRISDNAEYLKGIRLPVPPTFTGAANESSVVMHVDWRNLRPEARQSFSSQVLGVLLPQSQVTGEGLSIINLPEVLSLAASQRIASWFTRSESMDLRFQIDAQYRVQLAVDVVNRTLTGIRPAQTPFTEANIDNLIAQGQWNLPIEFEFRNLVQTWAAPFQGDIKNLFQGDVIEGQQGKNTLQEGARVLARHALELITQPNLQGCFAAQERSGRPVIAAGLRITNAARFDTDLQKLLKLAVDDGAQMKFQLNEPNQFDATLHRIELPITAESKAFQDVLGDVAVIHIATTQHVVLLGVGEGSQELMAQLIAPGSASSPSLLSTTVASQSTLGTKLGLAPASISVTPIAQGFRLFATLPEGEPQEGRLTRTAQ